MKRYLGLALLVAALAAVPARAATISFSGEVFGGMSIPIEQDDADQGTVFGARVPVQVMHLLTLEPWYAQSAMGDKSVDIAGLPYEIDGGDLNGFGLNARLGGLGVPGLSFFPYIGIGSYTLTREGSDDITDVGYLGGLGLNLTPMPKLGIGLRGEFVMVATGDTSRKYGNVTLGVSYHFLSTP